MKPDTTLPGLPLAFGASSPGLASRFEIECKVIHSMQDVYSSALYIIARFITDGFDLGTRTSRPAGTFEERSI